MANGQTVRARRWSCVLPNCGREWVSLLPHRPLRCPRCRSRFWHKPPTVRRLRWWRAMGLIGDVELERRLNDL